MACQNPLSTSYRLSCTCKSYHSAVPPSPSPLLSGHTVFSCFRAFSPPSDRRLISSNISLTLKLGHSYPHRTSTAPLSSARIGKLLGPSGNILINRGDIDDILTNQYFFDNHIDSFAFLLSEKIRIIPKEFQKYLYISPLYRLYKGYKHDYQMFIQHITPDSVRESKLIVQPICFQSHWVLIVGKLKEKVWKLYDSLSNPEHKTICTEVIKQIHEDKAGVFPSDITTWKLQTVRGIPTQSNEYDCGIFVCKYMERAILKKKTDWASLKEWQKYMPKFRAELGYALCLTTKIPLFCSAETSKFRAHLLERLSKKDIFDDSVEEIVRICTEILSNFLQTEYGGPGTLLVVPFIDMADTINERGLPGGPQAARAAVLWAQKHIDKDWKDWTGDPNL
ncbi:hypothetical protein IEQ34_009820 [Dendrobium chrysotoxum]|uniref:Ubiquitin-like protease family profile domain-containing protein n=1 Tax=Dendrobium chrysotoxum TaxID=161865 RepID=A0AAV7H404_DENCH|nr:hypothetical protein IEQ34_009820 [Dendrobium chrysotoxum]